MVYLDNDYFSTLCKEMGAYESMQKEKLREEVYRKVSDFINNKQNSIIIFDIYNTGSEKLLKSIEIVPLEKSIFRFLSFSKLEMKLRVFFSKLKIRKKH